MIFINSLIDNYTKDELEYIVNNSKSLAEVLLKLGYKSCNGRNPDTLKKKLDSYNISYNHFTHINKNRKLTYNDVFCANSNITQKVLRCWYIKTYGEAKKCSICNIDRIWNGEELTMILDHIDGNNHNNLISNLRWICPNCNSQLDTFAGRNTKNKNKYISVNSKKSNKKICPICNITEISKNSKMCRECRNKEIAKNIPPKEDLEKLIYNTPFTKIGDIYGVSDNAVRKWCKKYELPYKYGQLYKMRT